MSLHPSLTRARWGPKNSCPNPRSTQHVSWSRTWEYHTWPWYWIEPNGELRLCNVWETQANTCQWSSIWNFPTELCSKEWQRALAKKIKGINASMLPPCQSALYEKLRRTNFMATIWKDASIPEPCSLSPMENGWKLQNEMVWGRHSTSDCLTNPRRWHWSSRRRSGNWF